MTAALHLVTDDEFIRASAIEAWLAGYPSDTSRRSMGSALRTVARTSLALGPRDPVDVTAYPFELLADLLFLEGLNRQIIARYGMEHGAKYMIAVRALLRYLARTRLADRATVQRTLSDFKVRHVSSGAPPLTFTSNDILALLRQCACDSNCVKGYRDLALISVGLSTGGRRSELVGVMTTDLDLDERLVKLHVKGGGTRDAALHPATKEHVERWLALRGDGYGPLFLALRKGGRITDEPLSDHQYWKILRQRSEAVGIEPAIAPHDLRRWFVSTLLENGTDVFQVAHAVGHKRIATTFRYDRRPQNRLREVVDGLSLPMLADLEALDGEGE